ncbi:efflux RND transporter permease subunit [Azoarcus taiwanensis]|uniref:AcrB/AcrD/AcrF family protein n=1 Tax=Azoarcus taiwanensis TaxID=666964 RepID=A0A972F725_9RHOO|nr:efflux RND transporter permease subunit [Azoarcus taiwanensis]NMG02794.1 AcrB/AcrD/AcrF family protein [Azoarcus taiwanensis]
MSGERHARTRTGGLAALAISRPVGTMALASVVFVLGFFFLRQLPIDLLPEIEYPQIRVTVTYPGVAPEVVEEQVTRVLERSLAATEGVTSIQSRVWEGRTDVDLTFEFGTNLDFALQDAARYLEQARSRMPGDINPPRIRKFDPGQTPVWEGGFGSNVRSEAEVREWVENSLMPQLISIAGVSSVEASGGMVREMEVVVDQERLRSYGLTLADVVSSLAAENVEIAGGRMTSEVFDVSVKTEGKFTSAAEIDNVLLRLPGTARSIRLAEVAQVRDGHREQRVFARLDGVPSTQVQVFKLIGTNTVQVADEVQETLVRLERSGFIPPDIQYQMFRDQTYFIRGALTSVGSAALLGGMLAMLVVLLFLASLRKGFIIGLSIPIALMATFSLMGVGGLTLNIISLGGLALGVGLLLDNAIVVLENISRHREKLGKPALEAAREGTAEVVTAITAGTLTNLAAVVPFLLVTGVAALVFREMILTITFAIVATLAAALTVVPMLAAQLGRVRFQSGLNRSLPLRAFGGLIDWLTGVYRALLPWILRLRWLVLAAAAASLVGAAWLFSQLGNEFLPPMDDGNVYVRVALPQGTPPEDTQAMARQVEDVLRGMPHVQSVFTLAGGSLWGGVVNERSGLAQFLVQLVSVDDRPDVPAGQWILDAQREIRALELPGARIFARPPVIRGLRFTATGNDLAIGVVGPDLDVLRLLAREVAARLDGVPGLEGVDAGTDDQSPLVRVRVDRERAAEFGLSVADVGRAIRDAVDGAVPTRFTSGSQEYDVRVRLPGAAVGDTEVLGNLLVARGNGSAVLLRDVVHFELGTGPATILRENQSRIMRVVADINTSVADAGTVMREVESRLADLALPEQYGLLFGGQWETIEQSNRELTLVIMLAVFLVFVVLAVQYDRLANPLVIITAAPLSLVGVSIILTLTATPVSAPVLLGGILLIGIVVNNAILLVEYIEIGRRNGLAMRDAIVEAGSVRLRPILMTTSTTAMGMLPLAIGLGEGGEIMRPLALSVIGGLTSSMILTLIVVPCLYLILVGSAERLGAWLTGRAPDRDDKLGQTES